MRSFLVRRKEVHIQCVLVDASNENDARNRVIEGEGQETDPASYNYTLDPETWHVEQFAGEK